MMTGSFDPIAQGEDWNWSHTIIADDTDELMNLDGCNFFLRITHPHGSPPFWDYGRLCGGFYGLDFCWTARPLAILSTGNGVLTAQEGTIVAIVPGTQTRCWPRGENRLTLDVQRNGETVRLVDIKLPVTGF